MLNENDKVKIRESLEMIIRDNLSTISSSQSNWSDKTIAYKQLSTTAVFANSNGYLPKTLIQNYHDEGRQIIEKISEKVNSYHLDSIKIKK